jgi:hypothetical protein
MPDRLLRLELVPVHEHPTEKGPVEAWEVRTPRDQPAYVLAFEEAVEGAFEEGAGRLDHLERLAKELGRILGGQRGLLTIVPPGCKLRIYEVQDVPVIIVGGGEDPGGEHVS